MFVLYIAPNYFKMNITWAVSISFKTTVGDLGSDYTYLTNLPIIDPHQIIMTCPPIIIFSLSDSLRVNDTEKR